MAIEHDAIIDGERHEPKGIDSASSGQVYLSDGLGSGTWTTISSSVVIVNSVNDLPAPVDVGGVSSIRLEDKEYILNADLTISTPLAFPGAGKRATIRTVNRNTLTYNGTNALFRDTDAAGDLELYGLTEFKAPNGKMFDLSTVSSSFSFQSFGPCRFTDCNSLGTMKGNGVSGAGFFFGTFSDFDNGFVFEDMAFIEINTMFMFGNDIAGNNYLVYQGSIWAGSINIWECTFGIPANATLFDLKTTIQSGVDSVNIRGNQQEGGILGTIFAGSSLTEKSNKVLSTGNQIIDDTRFGGMLYMTGNATNTVIDTVNVAKLVAGTWTVDSTSHFTGTTAGRLTYNDSRTITTDVDVSISMDPVSGTNKNLKAYIAKNGTKITGSAKSILTNNGDPQNICLFWKVSMATNDYIEVFVENNTDNVDIKVRDIVLRIP